jgi:hypothetical protein
MYVKYSKNVNTKNYYGHLFIKAPPRKIPGRRSHFIPVGLEFYIQTQLCN